MNEIVKDGIVRWDGEIEGQVHVCLLLQVEA